MNLGGMEVEKKERITGGAAGGSASCGCRRSAKCLTKMHFLLLSALLSSSSFTTALQLTRLDVPSIADPRWEKITLRCEYDLEDLDLYSVKWYKDGAEFFRYMPGSSPKGRDFTVKGVLVDVSRSDSKQVTLLGQSNSRKNRVNLAGAYGCEVSTEGPSFLTTYSEANMSVAVPPKRPPVLEGLRHYYEVGEVLTAECTSAPSYPPAILTFILNGKEMTKHVKNLNQDSYMEGNVVSTTRLGLELRLERQHFPGGSLSLVCQSNLPGIPSVRPLKSEKTVTLAASNQRLAQEPPRPSVSSATKTLAFISLISCLVVLV